MKIKWVLAAIIVAVLILDVSAERRKGRRKIKKNQDLKSETIDTPPKPTDEEDPRYWIEQLEKQGEDSFHESERRRIKEMAEQLKQGIVPHRTNEIIVDECSKIQCSAGRVCEIDKKGEPECVCIKECPFETEERRRVCTNYNETWGSDCEVHQQRCVCMKNQEDCKDPKYSHVQVEYYGTCREMPECKGEELEDFPRRMRDWLFNIMRDLADRHELSEHYMELEKEAESNLTRRWTNAAIWKWCDLDAEDNDRFVSRHELFPIRAPLLALEHCIGPFLNNCDYDSDHRITLKEWGKCLQLDEDDLFERCEDISDDAF